MKKLSYAEKIKKLRDFNEWSQEQAAIHLGVAQATISRLEKEEWVPSRPIQMHIDNLWAIHKGTAA
jgi:DNA-binding XRE family transcriptional regulator